MPTWAYIAAALIGSLAGAVLDATLYADGGSLFMKIGLVASPVAIWLIARARKEEGSE